MTDLLRQRSAASLLASAVLALGLVLSDSASAREMYRYTNDQGVQVVAYQVPPEFVAGGYEVLNERGVTVRVVPPQLDASQRANLNAQQQQEQLARAEQERLRAWDESLLLRYSTVEDIEAARDRALRDLKIRVSILKGKLRSLKQQVENYQALAANQERQGKAVDVSHVSSIDDLQSEILATERAVADRQEEITEVEANYARDITRFATLLDVVEMRKAMSTGEDPGS